jgi:glycosyltransferase involved in cell wall biosynthesis
VIEAARPALEEGVRPLAPSLKAITLPEVVVKLALGAASRANGDQVEILFEGESIRMHREDFDLASRVSARVRAQMPKRLSPGGVIKATALAHKGISDELFRPGAVRVLYYSTMSKASAFYRCLMPMYALNMSGKAVAHASAARFGREALDYDVIVIQIDNSPSALEFVKALQGMGKKVVYEVDDAFDCLEPWHPQYASYGQPARQAAIQAMMRQADAVQVSTQWLANRYCSIANRIEVVPNMVELAAWPKADRLRRDGLWRVLWAGSPSHSGDLAEVVPALGRFARAHPDVRIVLFGQEIKDDRIPAGQVENIPWCEFEEYPFKLAAVDADVAIAPLADIPFNCGKSNLRILQYWATGYPVIASDVGPYRDAIVESRAGLLCRTEEDWSGALESTYRNTPSCGALSMAGGEVVKAWDVIVHAKQIEALYSSLMTVRR